MPCEVKNIRIVEVLLTVCMVFINNEYVLLIISCYWPSCARVRCTLNLILDLINIAVYL